jgi:4-amino-4-deoxy-L-arabinose transferase-like glycosyltransferase
MTGRLASPSGHDPALNAVKRQPATGGEPVQRACRRWSSVAVGTVALAVLFAMASRSPAYGVYDEPSYIRYAQLLDRFGWSQQFLNHLPGTPGPLVAVVERATAPLTGLALPGIRLVNATLFGLCICVCFVTARAAGSARWIVAGLAVVGIPAAWPVAGLALSDAPAWLFLCICAYLSVRWLNTPAEDWRSLLAWGALGGLALGVAAMGRQSALVLLAFPVFFAFSAKRRWPSAVAFIVCAAAVIGPILWTWKGLAPPTGFRVHVGLSPAYACQSFACAAVIMGLLAPRFYLWRPVWVTGALGAGLLVNATTGALRFPLPPFASLAHRLGPAELEAYSRYTPALMPALTLYFTGCLAVRCWENRADAAYVLGAFGSFAIALSALAIRDGYSSRYTAMALPFFALVADRHSQATWWKAARIAVGAAMGVVSLSAYYHMHGWELPWDAVLRR